MRKLFVLLVSTTLVACGGGADTGPNVPSGPTACSNDNQKQFVLDALYFWYLWNDLLPANINIDDYASPEELVFEVTTTFGPQNPGGGPLDLFSSVGSAQADQQFFGEGKFEGFGFSWRFEGSDMRLTSVFAGSPADGGGLERGHTILSLNGRTVTDITNNEGLSAFFDANDTVTFELQRVDMSVFTTPPVTKAIVTIDPIPNANIRIIDMGAGVPPLGYFELSHFLSTANPEFDTVFADFVAAGVKDVVIDMRYNIGGLVSTAELLGDYLGGFANDGLVFSNTEFNADRAADNNSSSFFARLGNSIDLTRVIVIASRRTASAPELVTNSMFPYADVWIVGDDTFGKPVGQIGIQFCEKILRPTSFQVTNANGEGDYFDGLPVDCPAADNLEIPVGADNDPNIVAAKSISSTGACPVMSVPGGQQAPEIVDEIRYPELRGSPARVYGNVF